MRLLRTILVSWIFFCFLAGCATHREAATHQEKRDLIVLLPEAGGKTGVVTVTTQGGSQVLYKARYAVEIEAIHQPPTAPSPMEEEEIDDVFGPALSALPDPANRFISFILYFEHDTTALTPESKALLAEVLKTIRSLESDEVYVMGHTDLVGTEGYNIRLSSRRANSVRDLFVSGGIKADTVFVSFYGKTRPLVPTEDEIPEPRNRRVEVFLR
jgi:outer membrane protein OmpA-like peptidoglycan-associated protein